jgi:hypothetical protein
MSTDTDRADGADAPLPIPEELRGDLMEILSANDAQSAPSEELDRLSEPSDDEHGGDGRQPAGQAPLDRVPSTLMRGSPEDGIVPGPRHPTHKKVPKMESVRTFVFDLADPDQAERYSEETQKVLDPMSKRMQVCPDIGPQILLDPAAPLGYRAIVVMRTADSGFVVVPNVEYDVVDRAALKPDRDPARVDSGDPKDELRRRKT